MDIRNDHDLRVAYRMVYMMADTIANATGMDKGTVESLLKANETIKEIKRNIRAYQRDKAAEREQVIVKDYGMDGFITLYQLPDVSDPEAYFEENERITCRPSAYDCTGQAFTSWHKIIKRRGHNMVYHRIAFDV